jgi:ABC-type transport system involved in multi-copper enzyme maturation permease subunit
MVGQSCRWRANPIVVKELRSRMRGGRFFALLTGFLVLLGLLSYALYRIAGATVGVMQAGLLSPTIGQMLFTGLAFFELLVILFITPALTAGTISQERENQTYELLMATPLAPQTLLWGKLISTLSYIFLLILAAVPFASLVFVFGGVAPGDMVKALIVLGVTAVTFGVIGLFFSAWMGRTARAAVLSYGVLLVFAVGTVFLFVLWGVLRNSIPPRAILLLNPFSGMASVLSEAEASGSSLLGVGTPLRIVAGDLRTIDAPRSMLSPRPTWHYTVALYAALSTGLYLLSTQLVKPVRRWHIGRAGRIVAIGLIVAYLIGGYGMWKSLAAESESARLPTPAPAVAPLLAPPAPVIIDPAIRPVPRAIGNPSPEVTPAGQATP